MQGLHPLPVIFIRKIIESSIKLLQKIRNVEIQMIYSSNIPYKRTEDQKYTGKNNLIILNEAFVDFSLEYAIEVKQLLKLLNLEDDNQLKALEQFLLLQTKRKCSKMYRDHWFFFFKKSSLILISFGFWSKETVRVAAICVYPKWVKTVQDSLKSKRFSSLIGKKLPILHYYVYYFKINVINCCVKIYLYNFMTSWFTDQNNKIESEISAIFPVAAGMIM